MSRIMEPVLQLLALGIFAAVMVLSMPFWLLTLAFQRGYSLPTVPDWVFRFMKSEAVWGSIAVVAWISFVLGLQFKG